MLEVIFDGTNSHRNHLVKDKGCCGGMNRITIFVAAVVLTVVTVIYYFSYSNPLQIYKPTSSLEAELVNHLSDEVDDDSDLDDEENPYLDNHISKTRKPDKKTTTTQTPYTKQNKIHFGEVSREELDIFHQESIVENQHSKNNDIKFDKNKVSTQEKGEFIKRFPQAIIAGVKKCGTRAMLAFLAKHPSVRSGRKEMHFFDKNNNYERGIDFYLSEMPASFENELTIEKTPGYFVSEEAPTRIKAFSPDIKLVFIFRDPVERAISDFTQTVAKSNGTKVKPFKKRVLTSGAVNPENSLVKIGLYSKHLERWLNHFSLKQMLFVNGDAFIRDPVEIMMEVQRFLEIPIVLDENSFRFNATKGFFCLHTTNESGEDRTDCLGSNKGRKHVKVDKTARSLLVDFYRKPNKKFFGIIGKNFGWPT